MTNSGGTALCPVEHFHDPERPRRTAEGSRLCHGCLFRLEDQLAELPALYDDVLDHTHRGGAGPVSGTRDQPAVVTDEQIEARFVIHNTLVGWCRVVSEEREVGLPAVDTVAAMCTFLQRHSLWLTAHEAADEYADGINYATREARRMAYPGRPERTYIGDCPVGLSSGSGEMSPCAERLYAYPDTPEVQCPRCLTKDTVEGWFRLLVGGDHIVTGATLAALLSARYLHPISPSLVRLWASRGRIERVGVDELNRPLYDLDAVVVYTDTLYQRVGQTV